MSTSFLCEIYYILLATGVTTIVYHNSWVFSLGESVRILGPEAVVDQMKAETQRLIGQYDIK